MHSTSATTAFWYLTRGTGVVTLIVLTLAVALGVANVRRARTARIPRFVFYAVHRNASLLAVALVAIHVATSLLDGYAPIRLLDVIVPFGSAYRPLWLGFGALSLDLLLAVLVTSLLRRRFGYRAWRAVHWAAYASWPVALLHSLGTGSDVKQPWMLAIAGGCVITVIVAVVARATAGWPTHAGARLTALGASALVPLGLLAWLPSGPLAAGWARKAGTPAALLAATATTTTAALRPFTANVSGTVTQTQLDNGLEQVEIPLTVSGQAPSSLDIRLVGEPIDGRGVQMTAGTVTFGSYQGRVTGLSGTNIDAVVSDGRGNSLRLSTKLQIDPSSGAATGTVTAGAGR